MDNGARQTCSHTCLSLLANPKPARQPKSAHTVSITETDKEAIRRYFAMPLEELDEETFKRTLKALRAKYHPDNFEKFEDEAVREMATERFQQIEDLARKIEAYLAGNILGTAALSTEPAEVFMHRHAVFAAHNLKVEILAADKDLKYHIFGSSYRWLQMGDRFKIPDTGASIIMDENHVGTRIGFHETIRMYLTFRKEDSIEKIVEWLFPYIASGANTLLIEGEKVAISPFNIFYAIRKRTFTGLELDAGR